MLDELEKLDRTPGHPLESRLRMDRVGAYGHSFGGAVSVELAREDSRVRAALELDGVLHGAAFSAWSGQASTVDRLALDDYPRGAY